MCRRSCVLSRALAILSFMLGNVSATTEVNQRDDAVEVDTVLPGAECYWLHGALSLSEQASLFEFLKAHDRTDWDNLPVCMNPAPKTLQLAHGIGGEVVSSLAFDCRTMTVASEAVCRVVGILCRCSLFSDRPYYKAASFSLAAIRYPSPNGTFPKHVDHCNDGSLVFLFSLGCHARFRVEVPPTTEQRSSSSRELELQSGDALVFDPSTRAAIAHAVAGVGGEESCPAALGERFDELRRFRYGIQCRVRF